MNTEQKTLPRLDKKYTTCFCRWDGDTQVQQCTLHKAHIDAIHEWAERARAAEAKLKEQRDWEAVAAGRAMTIAMLKAERELVGEAIDKRGYFSGVNAPYPPWIAYIPADDVLIIHGKKYSAAMFSDAGFLAPIGTVLRIEKGSSEAVTLTTLKPLEDQKIDEIMRPLTTKPYSWREFARAIENAHGIKENT